MWACQDQLKTTMRDTLTMHDTRSGKQRFTKFNYNLVDPPKKKSIYFNAPNRLVRSNVA